MFEDSRVVDPTAVFPALAAAIAAIPVRPERSEPSAAVTGEARALLVLRRQLEARLLGRVAAIDELQLVVPEGFANTAAWLRGYANLDPAPATALVRAARIGETLPGLAGLVAQGKVGPEHLNAVAAGAHRVPDRVLADHETTLVTLAPHARPGDLRRVAEKIQAVHDDAAGTERADHLHESREVTLSATFGGAYVLNGRLDPEAGASLQVALESLMAPRGVEDTRTTRQRRADALLELTSIGLRAGGLPDSGGDRPRLTFLIHTHHSDDPTTDRPTDRSTDHPTDRSSDDTAPAGGLARLLGRALTDLPGPPSGGRCAARTRPGTVFGVGEQLLSGLDTDIPTATIERIGCDAEINLAQVNHWGEPLNYGRSRREPSPAQRRALVIRDRHCVFPGCDRPPPWCQAHHLRFWTRDHGPTDLANLALVCSFHHHQLHEGGWQLHKTQPHHGPPGWTATAPTGRQLHHHRQPAA